jgi:hypothetical protein
LNADDGLLGVCLEGPGLVLDDGNLDRTPILSDGGKRQADGDGRRREHSGHRHLLLLPETTIALPGGDCNMTVETVNPFFATGGIAY